jgi:hypothetical protein
LPNLLFCLLQFLAKKSCKNHPLRNQKIPKLPLSMVLSGSVATNASMDVGTELMSLPNMLLVLENAIIGVNHLPMPTTIIIMTKILLKRN